MNEINFEIQDIEKIDLSMDVGVKEIYPPIENLEITPTKEQQIFTHENSYGYDKVTVDAIPDEYIIPDGTLPITENATYDVRKFAKVSASVYPEPNLQDKEVTPTKEIQTITSDDGYDGLNQVTVNSIPDTYIEPSGTLQITENGTYNVREYEQATVEVEGSGGSSKYAPRYISFYNYTGTELNDELSNLDTSNMISMNDMFTNCAKLTSLDLSSFNTSNVTEMYSMFSSCKKLTSLDLSSFDTSNVTNMKFMFHYCDTLKSIDLSSFDTSKVTEMQSMFQNCTFLPTLDLSSFNTSNVTNMSSMFNSCKSLTSLDLSSFNTSNVTNMQSMFYYCTKLTNINLSNFNVSGISNTQGMLNMFQNCSSLIELDLSSFGTIRVENIGNLFNGCTSLTSIDMRNFNVTGLRYGSRMFYNCSSLKHLDIRSFDTISLITSSKSDMFYKVPADCEIIVPNDKVKNYILGIRSDFTNVKTVAEL